MNFTVCFLILEKAGTVSIPAGMFNGNETIKISAVSDSEIFSKTFDGQPSSANPAKYIRSPVIDISVVGQEGLLEMSQVFDFLTTDQSVELNGFISIELKTETGSIGPVFHIVCMFD